MELNALMLSRLQFAFTAAFHFLFPPLSIGLGLILVIMEGMYIKTGEKVYEVLTKFWVKVFAITFGVGVASGIVMEFQFGTNWSSYSRYVGDIFGSALAAEGVFAFFLESGFLAVLVFGWDRVSKKVHFLSTILVSFGSLLSAVWIIVANSWQQTPVGYHIVNETVNGITRVRAEITDFWAVVFNPSSMIRLAHVILSSFVLAAFVVMSISAYYLLKKQYEDFAKRGMGIALILALVSSLLLPVVGHRHAQLVAEHQPAKLAAFEGLWETTSHAPLSLWGFPDEKNRTLRGAIEVPGLLSFLATGDASAEIKGLNEFPENEWPPVALPFYAYHIMVILGMFFIGVTALAMLLYIRRKLFETPWMLKILMWSVIAPYVAIQLGWMATEVGRQPWAVYGLLRTADSVSPSVAMGDVLTSLIIFVLIYILLTLLYFYVLDRRIKAGPMVLVEEGRVPYVAGTVPGYLSKKGKVKAAGSKGKNRKKGGK